MTPTLPRGILPMLRRLADGHDYSAVLRKPYVSGAVLFCGWQHAQPSPYEPADPAFLGKLLDIYDAQGGKGKPLYLALFPGRLPDWLLLEAEPDLAQETNVLGMRVWISKTRELDATRTPNVPISFDAPYQQNVRALVDVLAQGLAAADPDRTRVPAVGFVGPSMESAGMRNIPHTPYGGWAPEPHLHAFQEAARAWVCHPALTERWTVFRWVDGYGPISESGVTTSSQRTVADILEAGGPVVHLSESMAVDYGTTTWLENYVKTEAYPLREVANREFHAWEAWQPLSSSHMKPWTALRRNILMAYPDWLPAWFSPWAEDVSSGAHDVELAALGAKLVQA